jgi:hypothetical protein
MKFWYTKILRTLGTDSIFEKMITEKSHSSTEEFLPSIVQAGKIYDNKEKFIDDVNMISIDIL